jgi:membrane-associated phospholipid phosphatase
MHRGFRSFAGRFMPHGPLDLLRQLGVFAALYYAYRLTRGAVHGKAADAFENARHVVDIERSLHIFVEPSVQAWASGSSLVTDAASWMYINAQTSVTLGALVWLYLFRNDSFYFVRNMFAIAFLLAIVGYVLVPTAPPRFLPEWGFQDTVSEFTHISQDNVTLNALYNPYAAIPSMHVAFALMIGWPISRLVRWRALKVFWALYPLLVTFVIVATANHFITDAVLGALTAAVGASVATWLAHVRPEAWRFGPRTAEATA